MVPSSPTTNKPNQRDNGMTKQLLHYLASQEEVVLTYKASDIVLLVHSDNDYLNELKVQSRAGGYYFLSTNSNIPTKIEQY